MTLINRKHIAVGLSGGVDSAVTALRLVQQGHKVSGVYMQNWESTTNDPYCTAEQDLSDAKAVADQLDIPLHVVSFSQAYWDEVFQHCLDEFAAGRTPNPDIWCNKSIKFDHLIRYINELGADYLATGHYAQVTTNTPYQLLTSTDSQKDQTYFLYTLQQQQLQQAIFPLGDLNKTQVRQIAQEHNLINSNKKDSTGICFIGERHFKSFLQEFLLAQPGEIHTTNGKCIGQHDGIMFYTLGQRKGLNIGGKQDAEEAPWYVIDKDVVNNILIVGQGHDHPQLFKASLRCNDLHWVAGHAPARSLQASAKIRYRQIAQPCTLTLSDNTSEITVDFNAPQRAITPGQAVVFYQDHVCLGGGTIISA